MSVKTNSVSILVHKIFDNVEHALQCKHSFGDDYDMYCSYLMQFRETTDGRLTEIIPVTADVYYAIKLPVYNNMQLMIRAHKISKSCGGMIPETHDDAVQINQSYDERKYSLNWETREPIYPDRSL